MQNFQIDNDMTLDTNARYINPFTDFGFKKLFGTEANKELLMSFLQALLQREGKIIKLSDTETHEVFYNKLTFVYLEMPKFTKTEVELETLFDKWMYVLKNLAKLRDHPEALQERVFSKLFRIAEIEKLNKEERTAYEESLKSYWDFYNVINSAVGKVTREKDEIIREKDDALKEKDDALKEKDEIIVRTVEKFFDMGLSPDQIAEITGIDMNRINQINKRKG